MVSDCCFFFFQVLFGLRDHFATTVAHLWASCALSVAVRFLVFSFRFCRRDTEPLPKERLNRSIDTSKKNNNIKNSPRKSNDLQGENK